ncbi:MAG: dienelactone hydrolase family protein [Solirubrobacterales bacterium]
MSKVLVLYSAPGPRPGIESWAERLRGCGHEVWLAAPERLGAELAELPGEIVYAGFSTGAASAGHCAATRPGARGAVLIGGVAPLAELGVESWPERVPAQVHFSAEDSQVSRAEVGAFEHALDAARARLEIHVYPGSDHLLVDPGSAGHDPASAELLLARVLEFLHRCG